MDGMVTLVCLKFTHKNDLLNRKTSQVATSSGQILNKFAHLNATFQSSESAETHSFRSVEMKSEKLQLLNS